MNFSEFQSSSPARDMFRKLDLVNLLEEAHNWRSLRSRVVAYNDPDEGHFVKAARRCAGVCSSGERVLLLAILYVTDFAWLADELDKPRKGKGAGGTWRNFDRVSGDHKRAVAACIGAEVW